MPRTTTCTYHCSACGLHFHSLEAFDAHRVGDFASNDPELGRRCENPLDLDARLTLLTVAGECRIGSGVDVKREVTIWTTARQLGTRPWEAAYGAHVNATDAVERELVAHSQHERRSTHPPANGAPRLDVKRLRRPQCESDRGSAWVLAGR
jgi:hypothetical protein